MVSSRQREGKIRAARSTWKLFSPNRTVSTSDAGLFLMRHKKRIKSVSRRLVYSSWRHVCAGSQRRDADKQNGADFYGDDAWPTFPRFSPVTFIYICAVASVAGGAVYIRWMLFRALPLTKWVIACDAYLYTGLARKKSCGIGVNAGALKKETGRPHAVPKRPEFLMKFGETISHFGKFAT